MAGQILRISLQGARLLAVAAREWRRKVPAHESRLPEALRDALERLGPTFIKLGQALSLRQDLLPEIYVAALRDLQDHARPFPDSEAREEIEGGLGGTVNALFLDFAPTPMAAGSIAQVYAAKLADGRPVVVKVRRPGTRKRIDSDMRALTRAARIVVGVLPGLARFQPLRIVDEIWANLRKESDFRKEAQNIRRFVEAFRDRPEIYVPNVIDRLYSEAVIVQEMSGGRGIGDPAVTPDGPRLAQVLVDAYLYQFFTVGLFHGDPHPGNLFVMDDGRLCFHDFGLVGYLDARTRRALALFVRAFVQQDAAWMLDAAMDLGLLGGTLDRTIATRGIEEILADYSTLPLKDWSLGDMVMRVMRLGSGENFLVPHNLVVLLRAVLLAESAVRTLDPDFKVLDTLLARGKPMLQQLIQDAATASPFARLQAEAALTAQDLPNLVAAWLHRAQREHGAPLFSIRHEGLEELEIHLDRTGNRLALATVTLGLYGAASVLMLHGAGPRAFGDVPLLAVVGYGSALWLSWRLLRAINRSGRL